MAVKLRTKVEGVVLNDLETRRIDRHLERLEQRLAEWPEPIVTLFLAQRPDPPGITARARVRLGHLGGHLVGRESAETADQAVRNALEQITRQLERRSAARRGEPTFGVPSRRRAVPPSPPADAEAPHAE